MSAKAPNLIFVFPDQYRRQAMGCLNADPVLTPRLDRFAAEGALFTRAVSTFPVCSPYRASLLTGQYPYGNGVLGNCHSGRPGMELRADTVCFTDVLSRAGYNVGWIGKWHLEAPHEPYVGQPTREGQWWNEYTPPERRHGIDFWYSNGCNNKHLQPSYWVGDAPRDQQKTVEQWSLTHETDVALDYLRNEGGAQRDPAKPFALFISWNPPHPPYTLIPEEALAVYADRESADFLTRGNVGGGCVDDVMQWAKPYFAAVTAVDAQFGRILDCLDELGLADDTLVVFTSDHGDMMGSHGLVGKTVHWEESYGVPLLMRWPGRIAPRRDDLLVSQADLMPTILSMMGLGDRIPRSVEGVDYSRTVMTGSGPRPKSALYMRPQLDDPKLGERGVTTDRWKLVVWREAGDNGPTERRWLGDLQEDPLELENHLDRHPDVERELVGMLNDWLVRTNDPWDPVR